MLLFPFASYIAAAASITLLVMLAIAGDLRGRMLAVPIALCAVGIYGQFLTSSTLAGLAGLLLQTLLAIALVVRWRLND